MFPESYYPPINSEYSKILHDSIVIGTDAKILFAGCVKNCDARLYKNLNKLEYYCQHFNSQCFLFENNSTDLTKTILQEYNSKVFSFRALSIDNTDIEHSKDRSQYRRTIMAKARNQYLTYAKKLYENIKFDYLAVVDMDLDGFFSLEGLFTSLYFNHLDPKGCYGSNSIVYRPKADNPQETERLFYDSWAYRKLGSWVPESDEVINKMMFHRGMLPIPVNSCFGGLMLYPASILDHDIKYEDHDCDHVTLHAQLIYLGYKIYLNPSQITLYSETYYD